MDSAYQRFRATRMFGALDALRAVSILAVIWHHAGGDSCALPLLQRGFLGVDMFFTISGFLIVTLLLRERESRQTIDLGHFYWRRGLRIFPVYYALLLVLSLVLGVLKPEAALAEPFFAKLPYYLTYTSNWLPDATLLAITWSLATEEQFYLIWPPLEKYLRPPLIWLLLLSFLIVNQAIQFQLVQAYWPAWLVVARAHLEILLITFTPICLGVGLAHALHNPRSYRFVYRVTRKGWFLGGALTLIGWGVLQPDDFSGWPRLSVQLGMAWFLAACVVREDHALQRLTSWPTFRRIGIVSYGMYLYHPFALHLTRALCRAYEIESVAVGFTLCVMLTYGVAELSYRYYESVFLNWKNRLHQRSGKQHWGPMGASGPLSTP